MRESQGSRQSRRQAPLKMSDMYLTMFSASLCCAARSAIAIMLAFCLKCAAALCYCPLSQPRNGLYSREGILVWTVFSECRYIMRPLLCVALRWCTPEHVRPCKSEPGSSDWEIFGISASAGVIQAARATERIMSSLMAADPTPAAPVYPGCTALASARAAPCRRLRQATAGLS